MRPVAPTSENVGIATTFGASEDIQKVAESIVLDLLPLHVRSLITSNPNEGDGWVTPSLASAVTAARLSDIVHREFPKLRIDAITDAQGEIVFEWWRNEKSLLISVSGATSTFVKSWGPDYFQDMQDGVFASEAEVIEALRWLSEDA